MNNSDIRSVYLKRLFFNAGKTINDEIKRYCRHYVNYNYLNSIVMSLHNYPADTAFTLTDEFGAFFDILCSKIISELHYEDTVLLVIDPHFNEQTVCQVYFTDIDLIILNKIKRENTCKVNKLYSEICYEKALKINNIALEFLKKAYKYN